MIYPADSELFPVVTGEVFDAIEKDVVWQQQEIDMCGINPWYFIVNYCWTIRRDDTGSYVERVPPKEYLRLICQDWFEYPFYALSKSRQLLATWLFIILHVHSCIFKEHIHVCCQTKKEEDADSEMIQRARFVWNRLPFWLRKFSPAKYSFCKMLFPGTESIMRGIPAGGDQIRSHNPNYLLSDEIAFQPEAEESYTAALACCQRITLVTSANPGWARDFYKDDLKAVA